MPKPPFRVKRYAHAKYKFLVRGKILGKWKRRYFSTENEAIAFADQQNAKAQKRNGDEPSSLKGAMPHAAKSKRVARSMSVADFARLVTPTYLGPQIKRYLGDSWSMHLPFAYDLMRELAPRVFVELGVKQGESYFSFCQSAAENKINVRCYGVDSWRGDIQTGGLDPEIQHEVAEYNWQYSSFSELKLMLFAEALEDFPDATIDLLHIDGTHTYSDVKTDFESWLPKLSPNGVILLHDVMPRDRGFGVWKLWEEIAREDNSFLFEFGYGLGVWKKQPVASSDSPFVRRLLGANNTERRDISEYYANAAAALALWKMLQRQRRRHTHFTTEELIDAPVSPEIVDLYRDLIVEADHGLTDVAANADSSAKKGNKVKERAALQGVKPGEADFLPRGETVRRAEVALRSQIENLHREIQELTARLAQKDSRISEMEKGQQEERISYMAEKRELSAQARELAASLKTSEVEIEKVRKLFRARSVSLAESEARSDQLRASLRRQLQTIKKLTHLLDDLENAAARLRSSRRWQMANPIAALKEKISPGRGSLGYGHIEIIVSAYRKWLTTHPEVAAIDDQIRLLALGAVPPATSAPAPANKPATGEYVPPVPTKPIEFPIHEEAEISVIIPVFNQLHFTQACLASLQEHPDAERFEVIVVDDCSSDATSDVIGKIPGIVYLRNERNSGFTSSCNRGATEARGSFLLFLNNDTAVTPGWLSALHETFGNEPNAGLVGSKLVFPDGRLQEAGGIIWKDGSGWNRGKFGDAEKPEYNFLREVDYCSAACVMIPKSLFERVGGFDSKYSPAYYEDTDLAFKVRREGFKILYQPLSTVVHYEGATGGTDLQTGAKKFQEINRTTFINAWADVLAEKPANGDLASHDRLKPEQKRILVIDHHVPMPDRDSGSLRMFQMLKILRGLGHRVTFLPDNLANIAPYGAELQKRGIEVVYHPYATSVKGYLMAHGPEFDVVVLSRCDFARKHIANVRQYAPQSRTIFDTVDLHFLRDAREAELTQDAGAKLIAQDKRQQEYEVVDQADETWVVSSVEQKLLRSERPHKSIEIVSNIVDVPGSRTPFSIRRDFLFIGSFQHRPNIDAVLFFTKEIYPAVKLRLPAAKFYVIGDKAPPEVVALASESIVVTGRQPDVQPYFDNVRLSIAPLRWGAGVKGKINQSMAFGVPVVGTSIAVEGMDLINREDVMVADEPDQFAKAMIELYQSEELWNRLSQNAIVKTRDLYSVTAAQKQLRKLFNNQHLLSIPRDQKKSKLRELAT